MVNWTIVDWIPYRGFLSDRRARVRLDGVTGHSVKLHNGVPQGAVLSPLLFLFYIDGIRKTAPLDTCVSMYGGHCTRTTSRYGPNIRTNSRLSLRCRRQWTRSGYGARTINLASIRLSAKWHSSAQTQQKPNGPLQSH